MRRTIDDGRNARVHSRGSRPAAARRHTAPPCSRGRFRLSPASRLPGSGCLFEPVGVVQPAEDGGADDLGSLPTCAVDGVTRPVLGR